METYYGHVRTPADAIILFEACRIGLLPRVQRRPTQKECDTIRTGSVFVWDEHEAGMRRWTDGKSWSASRIAGSFLTNREIEAKPGGTNRSQSTISRAGRDEGPTAGNISPMALRSNPSHLHLISYYCRSHPAAANLQQPTTDTTLRHVRPQKGLYPESTVSVNDQQQVRAAPNRLHVESAGEVETSERPWTPCPPSPGSADTTRPIAIDEPRPLPPDEQTFVDVTAVTDSGYGSLTHRKAAFRRSENSAPNDGVNHCNQAYMQEGQPQLSKQPGVDMPLVPVSGAIDAMTGDLIGWSSWSYNTYLQNIGGWTQTTTWSPSKRTVTQREVNNTQHDMFCTGISLDEDGNFIVTGGNSAHVTSLYNVTTGEWVQKQYDAVDRGYQATTILSDGRIFLIGGSFNQFSNKATEVYDVRSDAFEKLPDAKVSAMLTSEAQKWRKDNHGWIFG